ncbi:RING-H2 finger protein ATL8-like [Triticum aestivum]|uniref:RING-H2 finger protein ATL8-like n=1 Tax=Triticum aestivum TaxID=4565 RepID=UPI00098BC46C|nr:RING-H2 finger protein ATL8-like [Aegilops tauschii subsp. strangulata]XP_044435043.1 RING-H2 finger protein ATL8-like [Triticum aestivum]
MDDDSLIAIVAFCSVGLSWVLVCCAACCCSGLEAAAGRRRSDTSLLSPRPPVVAAAGPSRRDARPEQQHERTAAPMPEPVVAGKPQLGHFMYSAAEEGGVRGASEKACAICLDELVDGMECSKVPACGHVYCRECIALWMRSRSTCPLCRELIVPGSEPLSAAEAMV